MRVRSVPNRAREAQRLKHPHRLGLALHRRRLELLRSRTRPGSPRRWLRPTATPITGATPCSRDAVLIASPVRKPSPDPGCTSSRTNASPVFTPTRNRSGSPPTASNSSAASTIRRPARTARSGSSSCAAGTPNTPTTASPMNFSTDAAVALDLCARHRRVATPASVHVLGIRGLRQRREADQVAEQRRHHLALLRCPPFAQPPAQCHTRGRTSRPPNWCPHCAQVITSQVYDPTGVRPAPPVPGEHRPCGSRQSPLTHGGHSDGHSPPAIALPEPNLLCLQNRQADVAHRLVGSTPAPPRSLPPTARHGLRGRPHQPRTLHLVPQHRHVLVERWVPQIDR